MRRPEQAIHRAVAQHLRQRAAPGVVWWHTPQGAFYGGKNQGAIMKSLGVRPGVSDIIAVHRGRIHCLELKAPGGRPTEAQMQFISDMNTAGAFACIAEGLDQALKVLENWGLLHGVAA